MPGEIYNNQQLTVEQAVRDTYNKEHPHWSDKVLNGINTLFNGHDASWWKERGMEKPVGELGIMGWLSPKGTMDIAKTIQKAGEVKPRERIIELTTNGRNDFNEANAAYRITHADELERAQQMARTQTPQRAGVEGSNPLAHNHGGTGFSVGKLFYEPSNKAVYSKVMGSDPVIMEMPVQEGVMTQIGESNVYSKPVDMSTVKQGQNIIFGKETPGAPTKGMTAWKLERVIPEKTVGRGLKRTVPAKQVWVEVPAEQRPGVNVQPYEAPRLTTGKTAYEAPIMEDVELVPESDVASRYTDNELQTYADWMLKNEDKAKPYWKAKRKAGDKLANDVYNAYKQISNGKFVNIQGTRLVVPEDPAGKLVIPTESELGAPASMNGIINSSVALPAEVKNGRTVAQRPIFGTKGVTGTGTFAELRGGDNPNYTGQFAASDIFDSSYYGNAGKRGFKNELIQNINEFTTDPAARKYAYEQAEILTKILDQYGGRSPVPQSVKAKSGFTVSDVLPDALRNPQTPQEVLDAQNYVKAQRALTTFFGDDMGSGLIEMFGKYGQTGNTGDVLVSDPYNGKHYTEIKSYQGELPFQRDVNHIPKRWGGDKSYSVAMNNPGNNIIVGRGVSDVPVKSNGNIVSFGKSRYKVVKNEQGGILYRK